MTSTHPTPQVGTQPATPMYLAPVEHPITVAGAARRWWVARVGALVLVDVGMVVLLVCCLRAGYTTTTNMVLLVGSGAMAVVVVAAGLARWRALLEVPGAWGWRSGRRGHLVDLLEPVVGVAGSVWVVWEIAGALDRLGSPVLSGAGAKAWGAAVVGIGLAVLVWVATGAAGLAQAGVWALTRRHLHHHHGGGSAAGGAVGGAAVERVRCIGASIRLVAPIVLVGSYEHAAVPPLLAVAASTAGMTALITYDRRRPTPALAAQPTDQGAVTASA